MEKFTSKSKSYLMVFYEWGLIRDRYADPDLRNPDSHLVIYLWPPHTDWEYNAKLAWLNERQNSGKGGECLKKWVWVMNNKLETDGERIRDK